MIRTLRTSLTVLVALCLLAVATPVRAQNAVPNGITPVTLSAGMYPLVPISATAAVNTATTLTIPAPTNAAYSNYVCWLAYEINSDATGAAVSNAVTTSTNFNTFALKVSFPATVSLDSGVQTVLGASGPGSGCAKSAVAGTATTFVSPASLTHVAFTWLGSYYQAP